MIVFILLHKFSRKTANTANIAVKNTNVKHIYFIISKETYNIDKKLLKIRDKNPNKISFFRHNRRGIKGAWLQCMEIAIKKNSNFLIFENDIVPTNFFFDFAKSCFLFYRNEKKFFGFTGYAAKNSSKVDNWSNLDTYLSHRSCSWSFGTNVKTAKKFLSFYKQTSPMKIRKILYKRMFEVGRDVYSHCLFDQNYNRYLIGYIWIAFMASQKGLWLYPSEHLVSYYGNDKFAENSTRNEKYIISNFDLKILKDVEIDFKKINKFSKKQNKKIINHFQPNIFQRVLIKLLSFLSIIKI